MTCLSVPAKGLGLGCGVRLASVMGSRPAECGGASAPTHTSLGPSHHLVHPLFARPSQTSAHSERPSFTVRLQGLVLFLLVPPPQALIMRMPSKLGAAGFAALLLASILIVFFWGKLRAEAPVVDVTPMTFSLGQDVSSPSISELWRRILRSVPANNSIERFSGASTWHASESGTPAPRRAQERSQVNTQLFVGQCIELAWPPCT
jgi:hypothetical protein